MDEKPVDVHHPGRYSILASIMLGSIMGPIDASIVKTEEGVKPLQLTILSK
jgi:hypothetical protein